MTEISFHLIAVDPVLYACRLLRKATRKGAGVAVTAPAQTLDRLDRELWAFDPVAFVPHQRVRAGETSSPRLRRTPVWLVDDPSVADPHEVLVNLGESSTPVGFESFGKLIEVVSADPQDRAAARRRWKYYKDRGYTLIEHEVVES